jgi:AcrR family transcriptional regulator
LAAPLYARQTAASNQSRQAIFHGAKQEIANVGSYESNIIKISELAQVSRATIYNQFADKKEMFEALVENEVIRLAEIAKSAQTKQEALYLVSREICQSAPIRKMIQTDPKDIAKLMTISEHPTWQLVGTYIKEIFQTDTATCGVILRWLIAQISAPLSAEQSAQQAERLAKL